MIYLALTASLLAKIEFDQKKAPPYLDTGRNLQRGIALNIAAFPDAKHL
jgi:hypothetical protein